MHFTYSIQMISEDFNKKCWCFYYIHMGSVTLHSCMLTALSLILQLSGKNRKILKENQFRLKDWAPMGILRSMKFFLMEICVMVVEGPLAGDPTPWSGWPQRNCWVSWTPFFKVFLRWPGQQSVNIKNVMMLFKREPAMPSWTTVCFASGIKHGRNWPENMRSP